MNKKIKENENQQIKRQKIDNITYNKPIKTGFRK